MCISNGNITTVSLESRDPNIIKLRTITETYIRILHYLFKKTHNIGIQSNCYRFLKREIPGSDNKIVEVSQEHDLIFSWFLSVCFTNFCN